MRVVFRRTTAMMRTCENSLRGGGGDGRRQSIGNRFGLFGGGSLHHHSHEGLGAATPHQDATVGSEALAFDGQIARKALVELGHAGPRTDAHVAQHLREPRHDAGEFGQRSLAAREHIESCTPVSSPSPVVARSGKIT